MPTMTVSHEIESAAAIADAKPKPFELLRGKTALVIIDMQRDFVQKGGYGQLQCPSAEAFNRVSQITSTLKEVLEESRKHGLTIIHTREGHVRDLSDCHASKVLRQRRTNPTRHRLCIGETGPMGRLLVQGEYGHDIIDDLKPLEGEIVLDKPAKGSFCNTNFYQILTSRGITQLILTGVTAECCVATTFREANDRGFECCVLSDCTAGFDDSLVSATLKLCYAYDGLFGYLADSTGFLNAVKKYEWSLPTKTCGLSCSFLHHSHAFDYSLGEKALISCIDALDKLPRGKIIQPHLDPRLWQAPSVSSPLRAIPFMITTEISENSAVIKHLQSLGAVLIGVLHRSESGLYPLMLNPLAEGLCSFLITTDTEGNTHTVDQLYDFNYTVFTPTKGTIPSTGVSMTCPSFDRLSLIAHSIDDCRLLWSMLLDHDKYDPYARHWRELPSPAIDSTSLRPIRLGTITYDRGQNMTEHKMVRYLEVLEEFSNECTVEVISCKLDKLERLSTLSEILHNQERLAALGGVRPKDEWEAQYFDKFRISGWEATLARQEWIKLRKHLQATFSDKNIDALVLPTAPWSATNGGGLHAKRFARLASDLDLCSTTICCPDKTSLTLMAPAGLDWRLADVAKELQKVIY